LLLVGVKVELELEFNNALAYHFTHLSQAIIEVTVELSSMASMFTLPNRTKKRQLSGALRHTTTSLGEYIRGMRILTNSAPVYF